MHAIEAEYYSTCLQKNCRKFTKTIYDFNKCLDVNFVNSLSNYGEIQINKFSNIISIAKDTFVIKGEGNLEISGVIGGKSVYVVIPKHKLELFKGFEQKLITYLQKK